MTEFQGLLAGVMLMFALFVFTFWPEEILANQRDKTRLDYLMERKDQLFENLPQRFGGMIGQNRMVQFRGQSKQSLVFGVDNLHADGIVR